MASGSDLRTEAPVGLMEAVVRAPDLHAACTVLLQDAVDVRGFGRAAAVVDDGAGLRGVVQASPGEVVERLSVDYDEVRPAVLNALEADGPSVVPDPGSFPSLRFDSYLVFPLPGPEGTGIGALIAEGDRIDEVAGAAAEAYRQCGPAVGRILELERLRTRERAASRDRELLLGMVDILPDPVVLTDRDNQILLSNRRADDLLTSSPDDTEGRRRAVEVNNLFLSSHLTQAAVGGPDERRVGELNLVDPEDGSDLVFEIFSRPADGGDPHTGAVFTVLRDITDLKKALTELEDQIRRSHLAEQQSRRESERLEVIIENVGEPILVSDQRSNIILMNREAEFLFEVSESLPPGAREARRIRANDTKITSLMSEFLLQPERRSSSTVELEDPESDESVPVEVVSTKIFDRRGEVSAVVSVLHDLTPYIENQRLAAELQTLNQELEQRVDDATEELAARNRELERQRRQLEKASRAKSEFLAGVSHELRTPINAILGYTSLLVEGIYGDLTDRQVESLEKVQAASDQLLALISDILDLSKIEAGKVSVDLEPLDLEEMTTDLAKTIEPMVQEKGLQFRLDVPDDPPSVRSDRTKVRQILLNLLSNAVKFTDDGSVTLRCRASSHDGCLCLEVADTGVGIEPDELDEIFEEFRQATQTSREGRGGAGLGLTITRRLAGLLGGRIDVSSEPGKGSVFTVELPLDPSEPPSEPPPADGTPGAPGG